MRLKKKIDELTFEGVEAPKPEHNSFSQYKSTLRKIVEENLGYYVSKTLQWDEYEQHFYLTLEESGRILLQGSVKHRSMDDFSILIADHCKIYPAMRIGPQIKELMERQENLRNKLHLLRVLYELHLEKQNES